MNARQWVVAWLAVFGIVVACAPAAEPAGQAAPRATAAASSASQGAPAASAPTAAARARSADYFAGKTITIIVPLAPGGPSTIFARLLADHLKKHLAGNPTIIIDHKVGAAGLVGMNWVYSAARKDGLTFGVFGSVLSPQIMGGEGVLYDGAQFVWLGGVVESQIGFAHESLGARTPRDLARPSQQLVVGGLSPENPKDLGLRAYLNLLGVPYKYVTGYPGNAEARLAFQRGEINFWEESLTGWVTFAVPLVNQGSVYPMGQRGTMKRGALARDTRAMDVPTYGEVAVELRGPDVRRTIEYRALEVVATMGAILRAIVYPPGVAPEITETMRAAIVETFADEEFRAAANKLLGFDIEFVPGNQAQDAVTDILRRANEDQEAMEYLRRLSQDRG